MMTGDAFSMYDGMGGADTMTGGSVTDTNTGWSDGYALNMMAGDAFYAEDSTYGADKLTGGNATAGSSGAVINIMYGDVGSGFNIGVDTLVVDSGSGDGELYANDQLFGGNGQVVNVLVGDTDEMYYGDVGGNDKITAGKTLEDYYIGSGDFDEFLYYFLGLELGSGDGENLLVGDANYMGWGSQGGNDTLISGTGNDLMFGDAVYDEGGSGGADRFVFGVSNGEDTIFDFSKAEGDKIDLTALKYNPQIRSFTGMNAPATDRIVSDGDGGTLIRLDMIWSNSGSNTIHLVGVDPASLDATCFIFG
jgi:Ca2+-binding RTX toxin-like protein